MNATPGRRSRRNGAEAERERVALPRLYDFGDAARCWQTAQNPDAGQRAVDVAFAGLR